MCLSQRENSVTVVIKKLKFGEEATVTLPSPIFLFLAVFNL